VQAPVLPKKKEKIKLIIFGSNLVAVVESLTWALGFHFTLTEALPGQLKNT
jgi:hypothetical protein